VSSRTGPIRYQKEIKEIRVKFVSIRAHKDENSNEKETKIKEKKGNNGGVCQEVCTMRTTERKNRKKFEH